MPDVDNKNIWGERSRLRFYGLTRDKNNKIRIGLKDKSTINEIKLLDYNLYNVPAKYEYRIDLIANEFYGDPKLWWVIVYANDLRHPMKDVTIDKRLRIPKFGELQSYLS